MNEAAFAPFFTEDNLHACTTPCAARVQAADAAAGGADYLGVGAVLPTTTKDTDVVGWDGLADVCQTTRLPVVAIGGVCEANARKALEAGCAGAALRRARLGICNCCCVSCGLQE